MARGDVRLLWRCEPPPRLDEIRRRALDELWLQGTAALGDALHDSPILIHRERETTDGLTTIQGTFWPYRYYFAQSRSSGLFDGVEAVGVSGLSVLGEGGRRAVALGRRTTSVAQYPGLWECIPSGGVDDSYARPDGTVDFAAMLLHEFVEEACLAADRVQRVTPFAVIYDSLARTYDICCELDVRATQAELIHAVRGSHEYSDVMIVPEDELAQCVKRLGEELVPLSRAMLEVHLL